jgi:cell division transport system permease protein
MLVNIYRIIKAGFFNLVRNGWLAVAAVGMMVITLMIISFFVMLSLLISQGSDMVKRKADMSVYFKPNATTEQVTQFINELKEDKNIVKINYKSSVEAENEYREMYKYRPKLLEALDNAGENSLPSSIQIDFVDPEKQGEIAPLIQKYQDKSIVDRPSYEGQKKEIVDKIISIANVTKKAGWVSAISFGFISLLIIFNTVRLAIFSRKEEIEIMKLVGATNWFIRGPFIFEGAIYGIIGTIISIAIMYPLISIFSPNISQFFGIANIFEFLTLNLWLVTGVMFALGTLIGVISSVFAVSKHLKL